MTADEFLNTQFHKFVIVSKKTGKEFEFILIGQTRGAAEQNLRTYTLPNWNWNRWTLQEAK